jgi:hypothetical protein
MSTKTTDFDRDEALLIEALKSREYSDPGPARLAFERRRLLGRVAQEERGPSRVVWRTVLVGGFAGAAAVAAAAVLLLVFAVPGSIDGPGPEVSLAGVWRLEAGDAIAMGTPVRVPETGRASLVMPDGTTLWAGPGTRLALDQADGSRIRVESGHLLAQVTPHNPGSGHFAVVTPDAEVQVHGTVFSVAVEEERTTVRLHHGEVRLLCAEKSVAMQPGHRVVASRGAIVSLDTFGEQEALVDLEMGRGAGPVLALGEPDDRAPAPVQDIHPVAGEAVDLLGEADLAPVEDAPDGTASDSAAATGSAKQPTRLELVAEAWRNGKYVEVVELTAGAGDARLMFYRARALGRIKRWSESGDVFATVAGQDPARKAEALYRAADAFKRARMYTRSLDMANQAIAMGGPNADHAFSVKLGALTGLGQYQAAAASAGVYLDIYPGGAHVGEAYFVRGTGERLSKKWRAAARAYGSFLSRGTGPAAMRDDASFYRGYCLLKAGDADAGQKALEEYLVDFPRGRHAGQAKTALGH